MSAEPSGFGYGKRWEDLLDAATSATSDAGGEDRTPVRALPRAESLPLTSENLQKLTKSQLPASPLSAPRSSLPPSQMQAYTASPLQQALTPPAYNFSPPALPSVETIPTPDRGPLDRTSGGMAPTSSGGANVQIYCAACQGVSLLRESYACTECVCGLCQMCVDVLMAGQGARRRCPRCACVGGRFKPFQLDVR